MSNLPDVNKAIELALIQGDLSKLTSTERVVFYKELCDSLGLNQLTKPFEYIRLNGKEVLYAKKDATDQLRKIYTVSITISAREKIDDIYVVTARGKDKTGREDESTGAVNVAGLKGDALANAFMKAETKAKRRVTLSICGLGLLDEVEVNDIAGARPVEMTKEISAPPEVEVDVEAEEPAFDPGEYVPTFGPWGPLKERGTGKILKPGSKLKDVSDIELADFMARIEKESKENKKPIVNTVAEFMNHARAHLEKKAADGEKIPF